MSLSSKASDNSDECPPLPPKQESTPLPPPRSANTVLTKTPPESPRNSLQLLESPNFRRRSQPMKQNRAPLVKPRPSTLYQQ